MKKKVLCCLLVIAIICSCTSCAYIKEFDNTPDAIVAKFCNGMKAYNGVKMNECMYDPVPADQIGLDGVNLSAFYKKEAAKMTYEIVETTLSDDGESATVEVDFTYVDASEVYADTTKAFVGKKLSALLTGSSAEGDMFITMFNEKAAAATLTTTVETAKFTVLKVGDDWRIKEMPNQIGNILSCNAGGTLASLFGL